jgi:hypothetical protein
MTTDIVLSTIPNDADDHGLVPSKHQALTFCTGYPFSPVSSLANRGEIHCRSVTSAHADGVSPFFAA